MSREANSLGGKNVRFEVFTAMTEKFRLLGCGAVWVLLEPTFLRNVWPPIFDDERIRELGIKSAVS
jgi:hypothetical protein